MISIGKGRQIYYREPSGSPMVEMTKGKRPSRPLWIDIYWYSGEIYQSVNCKQLMVNIKRLCFANSHIYRLTSSADSRQFTNFS